MNKIPNNLTPIDQSVIPHIDITKLENNSLQPNVYQQPFYQPISKLEETNQLLKKNNKELYSIHYEDIKTNAQLQTLLKTIDSQKDEIEKLKSINQELHEVNNTFQKSNKHSFRDGILLGLLPLFLEWIIKIIIYLLQYLEIIPK